jgi:hypothetical protein
MDIEKTSTSQGNLENNSSKNPQPTTTTKT